MTVSDLIRAGGGLAQEAYGGEAELARYEVRRRPDPPDRGDQDRPRARSWRATRPPTSPLAPFDLLVVKEISEWAGPGDRSDSKARSRFPGEYPIARGETLRAVIARAGGLTPLAFAEGSVFTREDLQERERQQIDSAGRAPAAGPRDAGPAGCAGRRAWREPGGGDAGDRPVAARGPARRRAVGRLVIDLDRDARASRVERRH